MRRFLLYMLAPLAFLLLGVWLAHLDVFGESRVVSPTVQASALDDPKVHRTVEAITGLSEDHQHPARLVPVDEPGIAFRFTMDPEIREGYRIGRRRSRSRNPWMFTWADVELAIGGGPAFEVLTRIRGGSSSRVEKKSMNVRLLSSQQFTDGVRMRRFFLINLYADQLGYKNYTCFRLLARVGLFPCYNQLAVATINDEPEGLFLLIERPQDAVRRVHDDVASVLRRRSDHFELKYTRPDHDALAVTEELWQAHTIEDDEEQIRAYEAVIDLDLYLKWRAFNSLMRNRDSLEEIYWFEQKAPGADRGRMRPAAWDFDRILGEPPDAADEDYVRDPLFWAAEGPIDRQIVDNALLYERYEQVLCRLLSEVFTEDVLVEQLSATKQVLDSVDHGFGAEEHRKTLERRAVEMAEFEAMVLERRLELLAAAGC